MVTPVLRSISPDATPDEIVAIVAAIAALSPAGGESTPSAEAMGLHEWVHGSRLVARGVPLQRGPWRFSGRIERRPRA